MNALFDTISAEMSVLGGFPVIAEAHVFPPDESVGIRTAEITDFRLFTLKHKPCPFIEKQMTKDDWEEVYAVLLASLDAGPDDYYC